jgi:hypothetical protein
MTDLHWDLLTVMTLPTGVPNHLFCVSRLKMEDVDIAVQNGTFRRVAPFNLQKRCIFDRWQVRESCIAVIDDVVAVRFRPEVAVVPVVMKAAFVHFEINQAESRE